MTTENKHKSPDGGTSSDLKQCDSRRLNELMVSLNLTKSFLADIFNVSRPTIYSWLKGITYMSKQQEVKLRWLEEFSHTLTSDMGNKMPLYKNVCLEPDKTLKDLLGEGRGEASDLANTLNLFVWELEIASATDRISHQSGDCIDGISDAYLDNG